ncbi:hypothetical protein BGZ58_006345 [Dissophora ornata]|nr:hypothetical protein BGZ58_006345 [Dissophora ornata]
MGPVPLALTALMVSALCIASSSQVHASLARGGAQAAWSQSDVQLNEQAAKMLAGSLEYSWSSTGSKPLQQQQQPLSGEATSDEVQLEDLESAFDISTIKSRLGAESTKEPRPLQGQRGNPEDCMVLVNDAVDESSRLLSEINKVYATNPDLTLVLGPLSKALVVPSKDDDRQVKFTAMSNLDMGLIGFHHIVQYLPEKITRSYLSKVIARAEALRRRTEDVVACENDSLLFDIKMSPSQQSCKTVQTFYDDYLTQVKAKIEARIAASASNAALLQDAMASLQFQAAGAYLTRQGAQDLAEQVEQSNSSEETTSLVEMMRLTIGAGDALQACQFSVQKSAIREETRVDSVSDFEQLIYNHLAMSVRRKSPLVRVEVEELSAVNAGDSIYEVCQKFLEEAVNGARAAAQGVEGKEVLPTIGAKTAQAILLKLMKKIEGRLNGQLVDMNDNELRQLESVMVILVRIIKDLPETNAYGVMKESLESLQQLEVQVHQLYGCMIANAPTTLIPEKSRDIEGSGDVEGLTQPGTEALRCDVLAESYHESLAQVLKRIVAASKKKNADKATLELLQLSVSALAEAAEDWDDYNAYDDYDDESIAASETDDESFSSESLLREIAVTSQTVQSKSIRGLSELVPFMIAQANSLEACSEVWRASQGMQSESHGREIGVSENEEERQEEDENEEDDEDESSDMV